MKLEIYGDEKYGFSGHGEYEPGIDPPLSSCPFCGSKNIAVFNTHTPSYWAECIECEAEKHSKYNFGDKIRSEIKAKKEHKKSFLSAIEEWNKRK